jgi:hypothetical protein
MPKFPFFNSAATAPGGHSWPGTYSDRRINVNHAVWLKLTYLPQYTPRQTIRQQRQSGNLAHSKRIDVAIRLEINRSDDLLKMKSWPAGRGLIEERVRLTRISPFIQITTGFSGVALIFNSSPLSHKVFEVVIAG